MSEVDLFKPFLFYNVAMQGVKMNPGLLFKFRTHA